MPPLAAMPLVRQVMKLQNVVTRGLHGVHPSIDGPLEGGGICVIGRTDHLLHTLPHMLVQVVQDQLYEREEVTVVEHVQADESTTKLNKIDQCRIEERNGEYASFAEGRPLREDGEDGIEKEIGSSEETCPNIKSGKNPKRGFESPKDEQKNRNRALSSSEP
ncbi:unnamed protein product [Lepeophtheirus salmonis]|uniref:(salmon louse) hypothetical protein n=1 Tax=Lepeophtheirus salmonis TaxID=72036 RepID=A0A7R8CGG0_LEPSM|nr:unnamed protein product [Lepeophtheirus salmonis]CAF2810434.1 unnamed protein product [Lepeophtheirus salmonis]